MSHSWAQTFTVSLLSLIGVFSFPNTGHALDCDHFVVGTSSPPSSGTPTVIDESTGTVISANFFNSSSISPTYFDGQESVSICISPVSSGGNRTATITTDVGRDNNFQIKAYPEFIVGTKFGNLSETSFRFYNTAQLPPEDRWPIVANGLDENGIPYEFANLEYVSIKREVGLPAFTSTLPDIFVTLDIDESNVIGVERDIMLESWFHDTSKNEAIIGNNSVTNLPIANSLNNIVGVGHKHYPALDNTLLEMMVHIAPLSPHDVSQSENNPGQHQLTEIYSGKDHDGDGIDDHFDVDSHAFVNSNNVNHPSPGIYSSGIDNNNDGIDDADLLPVVIGEFAYSIWYGESFLAPIVIFSRESGRSLSNDFDPNTPDINISTDGEITLPWHAFVDYTLFEIEESLQALNVHWAVGTNNPFPAMRSLSGAISGVEFGVEPQINAPNDQPYELTVNKFLVEVGDSTSGLITYRDGLPDTVNPVVVVSAPASDGENLPDDLTLLGSATDTGGSGLKDVRLAIRSLTLASWYNFSNDSFSGAVGNGAISANLSNTTSSASDWNYSVSLPAGEYTIAVRSIDNANNASAWSYRDFSVLAPDVQNPAVTISNPSSDNALLNPGTFNFTGTTTDAGGSGFKDVRLAIRSLTLASWYNFANDSFSSAIGNGAISANLSNTTSSASDWNYSVSLPAGDYTIAVRSIDNANNASAWSNRSFTVQ